MLSCNSGFDMNSLSNVYDACSDDVHDDVCKIFDHGMQLTSQYSTYRWNGRQTVKTQNLAEHHGNVCQYLVILFEFIDVPPEDQLKALKRAAVHDLPETILSDITYPVHVRYPKLSEAYDEAEYDVMHKDLGFIEDALDIEHGSNVWLLEKTADRLDRLIYAAYEHQLGNTSPWVEDTIKDESLVFHDSLKELYNIYGRKH